MQYSNDNSMCQVHRFHFSSRHTGLWAGQAATWHLRLQYRSVLCGHAPHRLSPIFLAHTEQGTMVLPRLSRSSSTDCRSRMPHAALERALAFLSDRVVHALLELVVCHPSLVGHLTGLATRGRLAKMNPCFFGPGAGGQTRVHTMTAGVFSISFSGLRAAGTLLLSSSSSFTLISQNL